MSIKQLRNALHSRIDQIDERFLKVMFAMTETYIKEQKDAELATKIEEKTPTESWKPLTEEELINRLEESSAQYKRGDFKDIDDVEKDAKQW